MTTKNILIVLIVLSIGIGIGYYSRSMKVSTEVLKGSASEAKLQIVEKPTEEQQLYIKALTMSTVGNPDTAPFDESKMQKNFDLAGVPMSTELHIVSYWCYGNMSFVHVPSTNTWYMWYASLGQWQVISYPPAGPCISRDWYI
jgi:hypothetical protein